MQTWTNSLYWPYGWSPLPLQCNSGGAKVGGHHATFFNVVCRVWHCVCAGYCCVVSGYSHEHRVCKHSVYTVWDYFRGMERSNRLKWWWWWSLLEKTSTATSRIIETRNKCAFYNNKSLFSNLKIKKNIAPSSRLRLWSVCRYRSFFYGFGSDCVSV